MTGLETLTPGFYTVTAINTVQSQASWDEVYMHTDVAFNAEYLASRGFIVWVTNNATGDEVWSNDNA